MAGWHHQLDGRETEWTLGDGDGQGGLACCDSWGCKESDMTEWLNWTELNWTECILVHSAIACMDIDRPLTTISKLFNLYAEYIMRNAGLEEAQAGIKIAGRNLNNLRYADDTTLMADRRGRVMNDIPGEVGQSMILWHKPIAFSWCRELPPSLLRII